MQVNPLAQAVEPEYPVPPHCPHLATILVKPAAVEVGMNLLDSVSLEVTLLGVVREVLSLVGTGGDATTIAGTLIVAIVQTFPPSEDTRPVYVVPPETPRVDPNVGSAAAKVITVFLYV